MNIGSRIRRSASLNEGTFDAPIKFARADMAGAEAPVKEKNWKGAAKIYIKNALERLGKKNPDLEEEKLKKRVFLGLASTFLKGGHAKEIKVGKIMLTPYDAENFSKAVKKELGIKSKVDKDAEEAAKKMKEKGYTKAPEMKVEESTFAKSVYKNAGLSKSRFFC